MFLLVKCMLCLCFQSYRTEILSLDTIFLFISTLRTKFFFLKWIFSVQTVDVCLSTFPINAVRGRPRAVHPHAVQLAPKFSLFPSNSLALPSPLHTARSDPILFHIYLLVRQISLKFWKLWLKCGIISFFWPLTNKGDFRLYFELFEKSYRGCQHSEKFKNKH